MNVEALPWELTIDGGDEGVTVSGDNQTRVFWVENNAEVTFKNLTITQGRVTGGNDGGGIYNNGGTIRLASNSTVSGNMATASGEGGGIYSNRGMITVNGTVSGNTSSWRGGGIYNDGGTVTVNGTVNGNTAVSRWGGGICNASGGT